MGGGRRREGKRQETKDQGTDGVAAAAAGDNQLNCFIGRATAQRTRICGDATTAKEKIIRKKCGGGMERHMAETWRVFASRGSEQFIQYRKQKNGGGWREVWRRDTRWEHSFRAVRHLREGLFPASLPKSTGALHTASQSVRRGQQQARSRWQHTQHSQQQTAAIYAVVRAAAVARESNS